MSGLADIQAMKALKLAKTNSQNLSNLLTTRPSKNLFNPVNAADGMIRSWTNGYWGSGGYTSYANGAMSGAMPVVPGNIYTLSMPSTESGFLNGVWCWDNSHNYLGMDHLVSGNIICLGVTVTTSTMNGRKQIIIDLTKATNVYFIETMIIYPYVAHTTADFNRITSEIQLELGNGFTSYEPFGTITNAIPELNMPSSYAGIKTNLNQLQGINSNLKVIKNSDMIYIRTPWDSSHDLVQSLQLNTNPASGSNGIINLNLIQLISNTISDANLPTSSMTWLKTCTDDACPANYNGTYIGANHGGFFAIQITVANHGKTVQDVGSEWTDGATPTPVKWYIMQIMDANTLLILSQNTGTGDLWQFSTTITGTTLTHSANATHTSPITFTSSTQAQFLPAVTNQTKTILMDSRNTINIDGAYTCGYLDIIHTYDITDLPSVLSFVISKVGSSTQPSFIDPSIALSARMTVTYRFTENGACSVFHSFKTYKNIKMNGYLGFIQSDVVTAPTGGFQKMYVPKTVSFTVNSHTYNLQNIQDVTNLADSLELTSTTWSDVNHLPDRFIQFATDSAGNKYNNFGHVVGYCPDYGLGVPSTRKANTTTALNIYTSKKSYPKCVSQGAGVYASDIIPPNTVLDVVAFRCPINYNNDSDATNVSWYSVGNAVYLMVDYHKNVNKVLKLPNQLIGKTITVLDSSNFTLQSSHVSADGIAYNVTNNYGYAVLKLT